MLKYWKTKKELPSSTNFYEDAKSNAFQQEFDDMKIENPLMHKIYPDT